MVVAVAARRRQFYIVGNGSRKFMEFHGIAIWRGSIDLHIKFQINAINDSVCMHASINGVYIFWAFCQNIACPKIANLILYICIKLAIILQKFEATANVRFVFVLHIFFSFLYLFFI